jgi:DNA modification methylase
MRRLLARSGGGTRTWRGPLAYAPTALIADAIRDVTRRGDIVLDPFAGTGTALVAAEKTGRQGRALERDPLHCDLIVRRWQEYTGKAARLLGSDLTFAEAEVQRRAASSASTA